MAFNPEAFDTDAFDTTAFDFGAGFSAPEFIGPSIADLSLLEDIAMGAVDFSTLFVGDGLTFTSVGTALPAGLSLSSAGVLSGTPTTQAVTTGIIIRATDANLQVVNSNSFAINVIAVPVGGGQTRMHFGFGMGFG